MILQVGKFSFFLDRPLIMGVVNVTPDSFSDGGEFVSSDSAVDHALKLVEEGVDILDIGGESTRPGAEDVSVDEELDRVLPVIKVLADKNLPVSVDTQKPQVMEAAIAAGACLINDVNALQAKESLEIVASSNVGVCLMHRQGNAKTMQLEPVYNNVVAEVKAFLLARADTARLKGIQQQRIILDPGFGFGKTRVHNFALLRSLSELSDTGFPILAGLSRKRMLGELTGRPPKERLAASVAAAIIAVQNGASIIRVHDVAATKDALMVLRACIDKEMS